MKLVLVLLTVGLAFAMVVATPGDAGVTDDLIQDRFLAELVARALRAARMSPFGFMGGGGIPSKKYSYVKRNSELINSILGLPKVMTDAGRK